MREFQYKLSNGVDEIILDNVPEGWDTLEYIFNRSKDMKSVGKVFTEKLLRFENKPNYADNNPYAFIQREYDKDGQDAEIYVSVNQRNPDTDAYDLVYIDNAIGIIGGDNSHDGDFWDLTLKNNGVMAKFSARDEVQLNPTADLDLDGNIIAPLYPETIKIFKEDLILKTFSAISSKVSQSYDTNTDINQTFPIKPITTLNDIGDDFNTADDLYINSFGQDVSVQIASIIEISLDVVIGDKQGVYDFFTVFIEAAVYDENNEITDTAQYFGVTSEASTTISDTIFINSTFTIPAGGRLRFIVTYQYQGIGSFTGSLIIDDTEFINSDRFIFDATVVPKTDERFAYAYFPDTLFSKLLENATGNGSLVSTPYGRIESGALGDGEFSYCGVGTGYMFRGFPWGVQPGTFSLKDLMYAHYGKDEVGFWFNGTTWIIERLEYFYQNILVLDLGEASDFKIESPDDIYHNEILSGQKDKVELEYANGLEDFSSPTTHNVPLKNSKGKLDISYDFITSSNIIEQTSQKTYESTSAEDTKYDDNYMFLQLREEGGVLRSDDGRDFNYIDNIYDGENKKNLKISNARNLRKHDPEINTSFWKKQGQDLTFASAQIVSDMTTQLGANDPVIIENGNVDQSDMREAYIDPERYNGKVGGMGYKEFAAIQNNPHGVFKFTNKGTAYYMFIDIFTFNLKSGIMSFVGYKKSGTPPPENVFSDQFTEQFT